MYLFFFMKAAYYSFKNSHHPFFIKAIYPVFILIVLSLSLPQKEVWYHSLSVGAANKESNRSDFFFKGTVHINEQM